MQSSILYITDNSLDPQIASLCLRVLMREAGEIEIISSSQKPVDVGDNVAVGEIGRSWKSLYRQLLAEGVEIPGLDQPTTRTKLSLTKSR